MTFSAQKLVKKCMHTKGINQKQSLLLLLHPLLASPLTCLEPLPKLERMETGTGDR